MSAPLEEVVAAEPCTVSVSEICGRIDRVDDGVVFGWAFDPARVNAPIRVQVRSGDRVLGTGVADLHRQVLAEAGFGDGKHAFRIELEVPFTVGTVAELTLHDADQGHLLAADPITVVCHDPSVLDASELNHRSVRARPPKALTSRRALTRRRLKRTARRVVGPVRRVVNRTRRERRPVPARPGVAPGTLARLERLESLSVGAVATIDVWPSLRLPSTDTPRISIIIPVHNQFHLTYQCLVSLILGAGAASFEVIVVDDCSTDASCAIESRVDNLVVVRNADNQGFLGSCLRGVEKARGDYLLFLNNDTEVEPGWADEMLDVFGRFDKVGAVGAKLVYPDGRLQDAGGIVWASGTPWNVGHGRDPDDPAFNYVRDVDYLTGAALMVSRAAWDDAGGFSAAYAPAYYEDTDLAFRIRECGYRTLFCPQATVIHHEGGSHGTSLDHGVKRHQVLNAETFRETWRAQYAGNGVEGVNLDREKDRRRGLRVLVIDHECPRLGRDAGSYAAVEEMKLMIGLDCKLTFLPRNLNDAGVHTEALQRLGIECVHRPWFDSIEEFLVRRGREFDAVYVTRYSVAESILDDVRRHSDAKVLFCNADLHFLREIRRALVSGDKDLSHARRTRERELAVMSRVDAVLSYNEVEHAVIASHLMRDDHVFMCPWVLDAAPSTVPFAEREGIAFMGGFGHPPNREAMEWFVSEVMPCVRALQPDLQLHIWGSRIPSDVNWNDLDGVVVRGFAPSLDSVFDQCRAFVAPLRSGAGIKGKVLDSVARGVPTVLSPIAAEATGLVDGVSTLLADSPQQWAEKIVALVNDEPLWSRLSEQSLALCQRRYSREHGLACMRMVFDALELDTRLDSQRRAS